MYEKEPYEENIWNVYICGKKPLLEHGVYEKVPCAHACARLSRLSFRALLTCGEAHVADVFLKMEQDRPTREHGFGCPLGMHFSKINSKLFMQ